MSDYQPTDREFTALAKILGYGTARIVTDSRAFQAIIRAAQAEARTKAIQEAARASANGLTGNALLALDREAADV